MKTQCLCECVGLESVVLTTGVSCARNECSVAITGTAPFAYTESELETSVLSFETAAVWVHKDAHVISANSNMFVSSLEIPCIASMCNTLADGTNRCCKFFVCLWSWS